MRAGANETDLRIRGGALDLVNQQEIPTDMAFAMVGSVSGQRMVAPFGA